MRYRNDYQKNVYAGLKGKVRQSTNRHQCREGMRLLTTPLRSCVEKSAQNMKHQTHYILLYQVVFSQHLTIKPISSPNV